MANIISVQVNQTGPSSAAGTARSHRVTIDRPLAKEGSDQGMMGGEMLLVALGGCFISNVLAAIRAREAAIDDVRLTINGTLASAPSRYNAIEMLVAAQTADRDLLAKIVTLSDRACIVANTLRPAVDLTIRLAD